MCAYALNSSPEYLAFWEFLGGVLEHILSREFIVSLGDTVNAHVGKDGDTLRGSEPELCFVIGPPC